MELSQVNNLNWFCSSPSVEIRKRFLLLSLRPRGQVCVRDELWVVLGGRRQMHPQSIFWWYVGLLGVGGPFAQPVLLARSLWRLFWGQCPAGIRAKGARGFLSADRSPGSVEMQDPVPTHVALDESRYILETVAGTRSEAPGSLHRRMGAHAGVKNE